jgi:hypothetical protein
MAKDNTDDQLLCDHAATLTDHRTGAKGRLVLRLLPDHDHPPTTGIAAAERSMPTVKDTNRPSRAEIKRRSTISSCEATWRH